MAAHTNKMYGTPSFGSCASLPNTIVKTIMVNKGRITLQAIPMTVCL